MKKFLSLVFIATILANTTDAQVTKGSILLGGDISGSTEKRKTGNETSFKASGVHIQPVFGKAIRENLVLGANLGFGIYNSEMLPSNGKLETDSYSAGVFLRKYRHIGSSGFYIFIQGGLNANFLKQNWENFNNNYNEIKRTTIGVAAYPGVSYAVSKKLHLEAGFNNLLMLNYSLEKGSNGTTAADYTTKAFDIATSLNGVTALNLGFRVLLGK